MNAVVTIKATPADLSLIVQALVTHRTKLTESYREASTLKSKTLLRQEQVAVDELIKKLS